MSYSKSDKTSFQQNKIPGTRVHVWGIVHWDIKRKQKGKGFCLRAAQDKVSTERPNTIRKWTYFQCNISLLWLVNSAINDNELRLSVWYSIHYCIRMLLVCVNIPDIQTRNRKKKRETENQTTESQSCYMAQERKRESKQRQLNAP